MLFLRKFFTLGIVMSLLFLARPSAVRASFEGHGWGVRAIGMGGAFAATADDATAVFFNPAGTAWLSQKEVSAMWQKAYPGLTDIQIVSGYVSAVLPTRIGTWGAALADHNFGNLLKENIGVAHYAFMLGDRVSVGVNAKYLFHDYRIATDPEFSGNPVFNNGSTKGAFALDGGILLRPMPAVSLGVTARNINEPDVGLASKDKVAGEYQAGLAWHPGKRNTLELDGVYTRQDAGSLNDNLDMALGGEFWLLSVSWLDMALRSGLVRNMGPQQKFAFKSVSMGTSLCFAQGQWISFRIDYGFVMDINVMGGFSSSLLGKSGVHKAGFTLLFGSFLERP